MFHMKDQGDIQYFCFQKSILLIRAKHHEQIFRSGKIRVRTVNIHAFVSVIMIVCVITIDSQHGKYTDQIQTLQDDIGDFRGIQIVIVGGKGQNTPGHGVHNIFTGSLHNDISRKVGGKFPSGSQKFGKIFCFLCGWQFAKEQQIGYFFKSEGILWNMLYQIGDIVSPIPELSIAGLFLTIFHTEGINS